MNKMTQNNVSEANPVIQKATDMLMAMSRDEEERLRYEAREEFLLDQKYLLKAAEINGIEIGVRKTALNLINLGMDDEFISKATGLPPKEIQKLRNQE